MADRFFSERFQQDHNGPEDSDGQSVQGDRGASAIDLQAIFQLSLDLICVADIDRSTFLHVNPAFTEVLGYCEQELLGVSYLKFIHPEDLEPTRRVIDECLRQGKKILNFKNRYRCKSGEYRWLNWVSQPQIDKGITIAVARDVTDEIEAGIRLEKVSRLLNTVLDAIPDVIGVQDNHHRVIRYNKAGYAFLGMTPEQSHGEKCHELIGHTTPCPVCATSEVYRTKRVARVEKYVPELDAWLDVRAYPVLGQSGELVQVIEHLRDITREKKAEAELKAAHERLTTILDSIDTHIYVADMASYEILFVNQKMRDDFGRELEGSRCFESFRAENAPCAHCTKSRLLDEKGNSTGTYVWDGQNPITGRWYTNHDRAIRWIDGRTVHLQIATDITQTKQYEQERTRIEQQLHQAQKFEAIGTLAAGIAHDFNNLLMGIQGRASLLMFDKTSSPPHQEHIRAIEDCIRSATGLTKQLIGLARGGKYEAKSFDLNELVTASLMMFGRTKKEIDIHTMVHGSPLVVKADRGQIEQVLLNLYINAWQAMPEGGDLSIETGRVLLTKEKIISPLAEAGRYVLVRVTDTGIGMDEHTLPRVFDPFFSSKDKERGTGLGLASAYGIIKNHGGMITVDSQLGKGATFTIYLPESEQLNLPEKPQVETLIKGEGTILLVDDEDIIIDVSQAMLTVLGYRVVVARTGQEALVAVERQGAGIDLVILDMIMPRMDGAKVFEAIRRIRPGMPVLLASGYAMDDKAERIMSRGCNGFLQKPFNLTELSTKVHAILVQVPSE